METHSNDHIKSSTNSARPASVPLLQYATVYFDVHQPVVGVSQAPLSSSNGISSNEAEKVDTVGRQDFERPEFTGTIISATASIPYVVGTTKEGKFEIGPRPAKSVLRDTLSNLSSLSTWHHTLVGWTGKVLPTGSAEFGGSLSYNSTVFAPTSTGGCLSNVAIHDLSGSGFSDAILQHLKDKSSVEQKVSVSRERRKELETLLEHAFKDKIIPVWMGDWADDKRDTLDLREQDRWHAYAESQLHHGMNGTTVARSPRDHQIFADYVRMNESVADAIIKVYKPGDIIWVHDYHLMLLPEILRRQIPSAYIAYFHYTSWADETIVNNIPNFKTVAAGTLGASAIGFSTDAVRKRAQHYYQRVLDCQYVENEVIRGGNRKIELLSIPLGIDVKSVHATAFGDSRADDHLKTLLKRYGAKKKIVLKAHCHRPGLLLSLLDGFEDFLSTRSSEAQNIVLFLVTAPGTQRLSTTSIDDTIDASTANRIVSINSQFGGVTHQPIIHVHRMIPRHEYFALLRSADLGIITSDHGAASSFSMEYVVCQQGRNSPLLIAGTQNGVGTEETPASWVSAEPHEIAAQITQAISLDDSTKENDHEKLLKSFTLNNVSKFNDAFIARICNSFARFAPFENVPDLDIKALATSFGSASRRLFMFDYDGTLTPIVNNPDAALPTKELLTALRSLAAEGRNKVWIISGRSRTFLEKLFGGIPGLGLSAEHGSFIRQPGEIEWNNLAASMDMGWKEEANKVFQELVDRVDGSWIERKEVAIVWHYRNAIDHDACLAKAIESKALLEGENLKNWDVEVMLGKANLEVRPRFLNKGVTAAGLIDETFDKESSSFVLCAGDDVTDEDMFRALLSSKLEKDGIFSCLVSKTAKPSLAYYRTPEPTGLVNAISILSRS